MYLTFGQVKNTIAQWADNIKKTCPHIAVNVISDTDEFLRVIFESKEHIAELLVECNSFSPYRYVKMEILSLTSDYPLPVYTWYDSQNDDINTIVCNLQIGLEFLK